MFSPTRTSFINTISVAVLAALLAACGGGGGGSSPAPATTTPAPTLPTPAPTYQLGGTVSGLTSGASVTLRNGTDSLNVAANGTFTLTTRLASGAAYSVSTTMPTGFTCTVSDGAGSVASADITKVAVKCSVILLAGKERLLKSAYAMAVDANGASYVLDSEDQVIWRVNTAGAIELFAGVRNTRGHQDGAAGVGTFNVTVQAAMAFDTRGNLLFTDTCNGLIRSVSPAGAISTVAGRLQSHCEDTPDFTGELTPINGPAASAVFDFPTAIAVDGAGNIAVYQSLYGNIRRIGTDGIVTTMYSPPTTPDRLNIAGIAYDKDGRLILSGTRDGVDRGIYRLDGGAPVLLTNGALSDVNTSAITKMVADKSGNLYFNYGSSVRKLGADGVVTNVAGTLANSQHIDGVGIAAAFLGINDLALNPDGSLTVLESAGRYLRVLTQAGSVTTLASTPVDLAYAGGSGATARFSTNDTLASAADGTIYTIDAVQNVVRKITPEGAVSLFAGIAGKAGADNGAIAVATFRRPTAITVDASGAVFVIDNNGLRKIADGVVSTVMPGSLISGSGYLRRMADGRFVVATLQHVYIFSATGTLLTSIDNAQISTVLGFGGDDSLNLEFRGIEVDANNNIYMAETYHSVILRYSSAGVITLFAGKVNAAVNSDGAAGTGSLSFETFGDMTIDSSGNLYLSGQGNVRKVSPQGVLSTPSLGWGRPNVLGITARNGLLYGSIVAGIVQTPLP